MYKRRVEERNKHIMYETTTGNITYLSIIVILSTIASIFFFTDPVRKVSNYKRAMNDFAAFFILSAIAFISYTSSFEAYKVYTIFMTNFLILCSFTLLKQGFMQRKSTTKVVLFSEPKYIILIFTIPLANSLIFHYFPGEYFFRSLIILSIIVFFVLSTVKYIAKDEADVSYGEKAAQVAINSVVIFIAILLILLFSTQDKTLYFPFITVTYISTLVLLMGAIQTMFLSDFADKYKKESNTDFLTQLYNRRYFIEKSQEFINLSKRSEINSSILMIDIDDFKFVNDTFGHDVGDKVLKNIAFTLKQQGRETDICARIGGEEFCIFLPQTEARGASLLADRIRESVESLVTSSHICDVRATISIGLCEIDRESFHIMTTIKHADRALYFAKEQGKNQVCDYNSIKHLHLKEQ